MANYKVQLEVKDAAYMQALLKLEQQQKVIHELSELLKIAEKDRDKYVNGCSEARVQLGELEHKFDEMTYLSLETEKVREQLQVAKNELKIKQGEEELLCIETELATSRESEVNGITNVELVENNAHLEKEKTVDLIRHISELNEAICLSKLAASEAEKEMSAALSAKAAELELAMEKVVELQKQLEEMSKQVELMHDLESEVRAKMLCTDLLDSGLKQTNELEWSNGKTASDDLINPKQIKTDLEIMDRESSDQALYFESLEMERNQLKEEVKNANEEIERFKDEIETLENQLEKIKLEMDEIKERETGAVEIALLKSELHKGRSKVAAAEAAEAKAESFRFGLSLAAVHHLAAETENINLKQGSSFWAYEEETENSILPKPLLEKTSSNIEEQWNHEVNERMDETATITISLEEYHSLIKNVNPTSANNLSNNNISSESTDELEKLKKELETAMVRTGEFRSRAEQAATRAEMAEKAKEAVEDQLRKWREHRQRRKAALAAMKEASEPPQFKPSMYEGTSKVYQPLGKVLNLKL